jgi:hypothetical protein
MPVVPRIGRFAAGAVVILFAGACQAWKFDQRPVPEVVQDHRNGKVALTTNNTNWIVMSTPSIEGDSIVGTRTGGAVWENSRAAIPVNAVRSVKTRQFSLRHTLGLAVVIALLPLAYILAFVEPE